MFTTQSFNYIDKSADELITKFKIKTAPVPVKDIALQLGIDLIEYNLGDGASGVLVIDNGHATIGYNPNDPLARQRFTISHEIGHYIHHREENSLFVDKNFLIRKFRNPNNTYSSEEYKQEQQANNFAASLLMPKSFLEAEMAKIDMDDYNELELIEYLAKKFQVSIAAMSFRLSNLNLFTSY